MDPDAGTLKLYEREIMRARSRIEIADLDNEIDRLTLDLIGKLSTKQQEQYQAARLRVLMGASPDDIVLRRAFLLNLSDAEIKRLTAPDVLTMEESAELVVIMRAIATWLKTCQDAGETDVSFRTLVNIARRQSRLAADRFFETYNRYPKLEDLPSSVMRIRRARSIVQLANRAGILLPPSDEGDHR
jgi:hypothetical protein